MRRSWLLALGALCVLSGSSVQAQEGIWSKIFRRPFFGAAQSKPAERKPVDSTNSAPAGRVLLGRPQPLNLGESHQSQAPSALDGEFRAIEFRSTPATPGAPTLVRSQTPDSPFAPPPPPPPPPPFPGAGGSPGFPGPVSPGVTLNPNDYNCGVVNNNADQGNFFVRTGDNLGRCWYDIRQGFAGLFVPGRGRAPFGTDQNFNYFSSPVTHPGYLEDPRAVTEFRPIFMWQRTPSDNPIFGGGDNFFLNFQGRVAITEYMTLVVHKLGVNWTEVENPTPLAQSHFGLSEIHIGPKVTFLRSEQSKTLMAAGLAFEVPVGPSKVFQDTGSLGLRPYFSIAQNFLESSYGSFNFMNTTGYDFAVGNDRTDFFFSSFHLDFNVGRFDVFFPFVDLHYTHYTGQGGARPFTFEGSDLFNFGSTARTGSDEFTAAFGARYLFSQQYQIGVGAEFNLLGNDTGSHLDKFRMTVDMIWRY